MSEWQTMETAPKDGTVIQLSSPDVRATEVGFWNLFEGSLCPDKIFPWTLLDSTCARGTNGWMEDAPTLWRELSKPPK